MTFRLFTFLFWSVLASISVGNSWAQTGRTTPVFETWSGDCGNTGVCFTSSFTRNQSVWLDLRIVRDWQADAQPLIRLTTNTELANDGVLRLELNGQTIEELPVAQLREIQATVPTPAGFRPLGGEGFWYPTGPATSNLLAELQKANQLVVHLKGINGTEPVAITIPLKGLTASLSWLDSRQDRTGTTAAIVSPGDAAAIDAPHADPILSPDQLPPEVAAIWSANRLCSTIDPAIFAGLNAVRSPLDDGASLYIIPCGAPTAHNSPYVAIHTGKDGAARQIHVTRMSEKGPVASDLIYNARWVPADRQLISYLKGSGIGECGLWNRWSWNGSGLVLLEEASRNTCDGTEPNLSNWSTSWPKENPAN